MSTPVNRRYGSDPRLLPTARQRNPKGPRLMSETCMVRVYNGGRDVTGHVCGKPAKGTGPAAFGDEQVPKCGTHLRGDKMRAENRARYDAERDEDTKRSNEATRRSTELYALTSVKSYPTYSRRFTGGLSLTPDAVEQLLTLLRETRKDHDS